MYQFAYSEGLLLDGTVEQVAVPVPQGGPYKIRVTLAWFDPPAQRLINDLKLDVFVRFGDSDDTLGADGRQHNVRQLTVDVPSAGNLFIRVSPVRYDLGHPYKSDNMRQPFALVYRIFPSTPITHG